ncbi:PREDICTED: translation initiation factor IF-2-like, partial [Chinchilla lanigera]|uniref:translation initiation factor IF-2-like n=1 Tax=Chinchilla lanigera TaxID=34839 RepID=UPI00069761AE
LSSESQLLQRGRPPSLSKPHRPLQAGALPLLTKAGCCCSQPMHGVRPLESLFRTPCRSLGGGRVPASAISLQSLFQGCGSHPAQPHDSPSAVKATTTGQRGVPRASTPPPHSESATELQNQQIVTKIYKSEFEDAAEEPGQRKQRPRFAAQPAPARVCVPSQHLGRCYRGTRGATGLIVHCPACDLQNQGSAPPPPRHTTPRPAPSGPRKSSRPRPSRPRKHLQAPPSSVRLRSAPPSSARGRKRERTRSVEAVPGRGEQAGRLHPRRAMQRACLRVPGRRAHERTLDAEVKVMRCECGRASAPVSLVCLCRDSETLRAHEDPMDTIIRENKRHEKDMRSVGWRRRRRRSTRKERRKRKRRRSGSRSRPSRVRVRTQSEADTLPSPSGTQHCGLNGGDTRRAAGPAAGRGHGVCGDAHRFPKHTALFPSARPPDVTRESS